MIEKRRAPRRIGIAVALIIGAHAKHSASTETTSDPVRHHAFSGVEMLALAGDQLLLWEVQGRAQIRTAAGTWSDEIQLPVKGILHVRPDGPGFLVEGSAGEKRPVVVLMSSTGKEIKRWPLAEYARGLVTGRHGRRVALRAGFRLLRDDGTIGPVEPYLDRHRGHDCCSSPTLIEDDDEAVVCNGADLSMEHNAPGSCVRLGNPGWAFEGPFVGPPIGCGRWIVARDGARLTKLTIRSLATGTIAGHASYRVPPVFACADGEYLIIGEKGLAQVSLPALKPAWRRSLPGPAVKDVAVTTTHIAYRTAGSSDIFVIPRPENRPRGDVGATGETGAGNGRR
jgi:hypothetical protein